MLHPITQRNGMVGGGVHCNDFKIDLSPLFIFVAECRLSTVPFTANLFCVWAPGKIKEKG
jgi:hypothetical protein